MREDIARFCRNIVEALHDSWVSPEERRLREEAEAQQRAEQERREQEADAARRAVAEMRRMKDEAEAQRIVEERARQEAEAKRLADQEALQKQIEAEAQQRAEEERRAREVEQKRRSDQEQALANAKAADVVSAIDEFLAANPDGDLATEAKVLRQTLIARDTAYAEAMNTADPTLLSVFLDLYPKGKPADEVRRRLQRLKRPSRPSRRALLIVGVGVGVLGTGAATIILRRRDDSIRTFTGHTSMVRSVAFAADGRSALSGSYDQTLRLWDVTKGSTIRTLIGHTAEVSSVAIAPDGRTAVSGSWDKTLRLWDLASGSTVRVLMGHSESVYTLRLRPTAAPRCQEARTKR
jgi:hypothetical protein